jgi:hypothetical protein
VGDDDVSELHVTDRALCLIIARLGSSATTNRIAQEPEPRSGWMIGYELAERRLRELRRRGLITWHSASHFESAGWHRLSEKGIALVARPTSEGELSRMARSQLRELEAVGAPTDVIRELIYTPPAEPASPPPSGRRARAHRPPGASAW